MAAAAQPDPLTLHEYLNTSYRPDCDFVDGHLEERNVGDNLHSLLQMELAFWFRSHREAWGIRVMGEIRTRVSTTRIRLPDIAVVFEDRALAEKVRPTPPLIAIEILSPRRPPPTPPSPPSRLLCHGRPPHLAPRPSGAHCLYLLCRRPSICRFSTSRPPKFPDLPRFT